MEINQILQSIGLNQKEAEVYLAALQLGQDTVFNIAQKSDIKRSTVYVVLESLIKKGLVHLIKTPKASFYIASNPNKLLRDIKHKQKIIQNVLPTLQTIYNSRPQKPKVQLYEGIKEMSEIYNQNIEYLKTGKEILCYGGMTHFYQGSVEFKKRLDKWILETAKNKSRVREIISVGEYENDYAQKIKLKKNKKHKIKRFPKNYHFTNDNIIYGNKIALFSTQKNFFAILIESQEIVQTYKNIFEILWEKL